jgi:hypothetical protein
MTIPLDVWANADHFRRAILQYRYLIPVGRKYDFPNAQLHL